MHRRGRMAIDIAVAFGGSSLGYGRTHDGHLGQVLVSDRRCCSGILSIECRSGDDTRRAAGHRRGRWFLLGRLRRRYEERNGTIRQGAQLACLPLITIILILIRIRILITTTVSNDDVVVRLDVVLMQVSDRLSMADDDDHGGNRRRCRCRRLASSSARAMHRNMLERRAPGDSLVLRQWQGGTKDRRGGVVGVVCFTVQEANVGVERRPCLHASEEEGVVPIALPHAG